MKKSLALRSVRDFYGGSFLTDAFSQADGTGRTDEAAEVTAYALGAYAPPSRPPTRA